MHGSNRCKSQVVLLTQVRGVLPSCHYPMLQRPHLRKMCRFGVVQSCDIIDALLRLRSHRLNHDSATCIVIMTRSAGVRQRRRPWCASLRC